ncbi:MAG: methylated-DNA--[protein]-cysteine S-methyltransferase [Anaeroplasma bactoclasticum]|nr:methylated-DNA--[protein]-cysteine S-methyltransferase [Anaeroplasma bactoclasticum]MCM1556403.1 methylated-DNA--[protein]-cysteine S-methyltransferase [Anaeroplasma bactoclasticum]
MLYYKKLASFLGTITIVCSEEYLIALWIEGQSLESHFDLQKMESKEIPILLQTEDWLKRYFNNEKPSLKELPMHLEGSPFQLEVWKLLCEIPYGTTATYKALALELARRMGKEKMSAQAVGGAVGRNPISIIIPCHRVIGTNGGMVGYNGGISIKEKLLHFEKNI